jgi:hypothetical protein
MDSPQTIVGDGRWGLRRFDRRRFLRAGLLGVAGLSVPELLAREARSVRPGKPAARAKNVLVILEQGGLSHLDTWDPKPLLPAEHASPFRPTATTVPGLRFTELLTHTARVAHRLVVVRSMRHKVSDHGAGTAYVLQGHPPDQLVAHPDIGSVVGSRIGSPCPYLPPYVLVPGNHEQAAVATPGFLSPGLAAFRTGGYDLSDPAWTVPNLARTGPLTASEWRSRRELANHLDTPFLGRAGDGRLEGMQRFYERAFDMLDNPQVTAAFNLKGEPDKVRDRYGLGHRGACYLLGRKIIEAGVRFVTVDVRWPLTGETPGGFNLNWDHHDLIYARGSCGTVRDKAGGEGRYGIGHWCMMGSTDRGFSALIEDMDQRGLLQETLVAFVTEFGRTPRLNKFQGRDHWPDAYSIVLAGAGIEGGRALGATDRDGGQVVDHPYSPADYAETIYAFLGIDTQDRLRTRDNRPVDLTAQGRPIEGL